MTDRLIMAYSEENKVFELFENSVRNPEIFVDGVQGISVAGASIKVNFFTRGASLPLQAPGSERRDVACRLVMGMDTFLSVVDFLKKIEAEFRAKMPRQGNVGG
jgi:hypothetical protein